MNKPIILVVEDDLSLLHAITKKLEINKFEVVGARSVEQAFDCLKGPHNICAVWLDHYLLGPESGIDILNSLKANEKTKHLPVFVVSNTATPDKIQMYLDMGVTKYYSKSETRLDEIVRDIEAEVK